MKKIIFVQHEPLTPNIEKKFCLCELINAGIELEYWDISQLLYPGINVADELFCSYRKIFSEFSDFVREFNNISNITAIIAEFFINNNTKKIWKLLRTSGIPIVKIERYANTGISKTLWQKIYSNINPLKLYKVIKKKFFDFCLKLEGLSGYDYVLTSGTKVNCNHEINHPDYDEYLLHKNDSSILPYKYICFIDIGYGKHPDQKFFYADVNESNEIWSKKLTGFFDVIEEKFGIPVVIAVHPKISYAKEDFGGREKIKYSTLNLVLNSEFVLQDISNSLSFSVIGNKKIGLITTNELWKKYKYYLTQLGKRLELPIFNIDKEPVEFFNPKEIPEEKRLSYMNDFLCSEKTKDTLTSDLLIDFFNRI